MEEDNKGDSGGLTRRDRWKKREVGSSRSRALPGTYGDRVVCLFLFFVEAIMDWKEEVDSKLSHRHLYINYELRKERGRGEKNNLKYNNNSSNNN